VYFPRLVESSAAQDRNVCQICTGRPCLFTKERARSAQEDIVFSQKKERGLPVPTCCLQLDPDLPSITCGMISQEQLRSDEQLD